MFHDRALAVVASFENLSQAEVARTLLAAEGIEAVIRDQPLASLLPAVVLANGGVTLLVPEDQVDRAREALSNPEPRGNPPGQAGSDA